jgi:hypothetical protein
MVAGQGIASLTYHELLYLDLVLVRLPAQRVLLAACHPCGTTQVSKTRGFGGLDAIHIIRVLPAALVGGGPPVFFTDRLDWTDRDRSLELAINEAVDE